MGLFFNINLNLVQNVSLNTVQLMKILQMNSVELSSYIDEALLENPALEAYEQPSFTISPHSYKKANRDDDSEADPLTIYGSSEDRISLYDVIFSQLKDSDAPEKNLAIKLATYLDTNAYISEDDFNDFTAKYGEQDARAALAFLQTLTPPGIGARNLSERLLLQLRRAEHSSPLAEKIVRDYFDDLVANRYGHIAKCEGIQLKEVYNAVRLIQKLDPFPYSEYKVESSTQYTVPDIILDENGEPKIADEWLPKLRTDAYYAQLLSETQDPEVKEYLSTKLRQAIWLINSISQRQNTILQCVTAIIARQKPFFESNGKAPLLPLTQNDIAEMIGVSASTVSRAINGKYLQCPYGSFAISSFFCSSVSGQHSTSVSSDRIKSKIKEMIAQESAGQPLSDQNIADILAQEDICISRRTIAKYRTELGIPNTSVRKAKNSLKSILSENN